MLNVFLIRIKIILDYKLFVNIDVFINNLYMQDILNRTRNHQFLPWYKTLKKYYQRPEWELYDLKYDPEELNNIAAKPSTKVA